MSDNPSINPSPEQVSAVKSRLTKCRRYRHGLARTPDVRRPMPRGDRAFLPCPRSEAEGSCPYRRIFRCTDELRARSLKEGGTCAIERDHYGTLLPSALKDVLEYREGETPGIPVLRAAQACCEAMVFLNRAMGYRGMLQTGEAKHPNERAIHRYYALGLHAWLDHMDRMVEARLRELGFDIERVRAVCLGNFSTWWRESRGKPWMREGLMGPDPRAA